MIAALPALFAGPGAAATEREQLDCLARLRRDYGVCLRDAQDRCRTEFESRLGGCFTRVDCPAACLAAQEECTKPLLLERSGCRLACQADARVAQRGCRIDPDQESCRHTVRAKLMKCRSQCNRTAAPKVQRCRDTLGDCLRACAGTK